MSDDGEPSGTAGRPILAVVMGSTLGDLTAVVTRYFGGTKLGTGGLVKAYTESVQMALMEIKTVEKVARVRVLVSGMTYRQYGNVKGPLEVLGGVVEEETFGEGVELLLLAVEERLGETTAALQEATGGQAEIEVLEAVEG
ncbi:ribosomal protein S5 domain 2-type protein [Baffinella frigidus]|nr:ribosomal protein S5 domain 2-type protein [Cryptophyta sp. CCMP2293]